MNLMMAVALTEREELRFDEMEHRLSDLFVTHGFFVRFCRGEGYGDERAITFIDRNAAIVATLPANQFVSGLDGDLLGDVKNQLVRL